MRHVWHQLGLDEKRNWGFDPLEMVRGCENCASYQVRQTLYDNATPNSVRGGPKILKHQWLPLVGRCKFEGGNKLI